MENKNSKFDKKFKLSDVLDNQSWANLITSTPNFWANYNKSEEKILAQDAEIFDKGDVLWAYIPNEVQARFMKDYSKPLTIVGMNESGMAVTIPSDRSK